MEMQTVAYVAATITTLSFIAFIIRKAVKSYKTVLNRISSLETSLEINQQFIVKKTCKAVTESSKIIEVEEGTRFSLKDSMKEYSIVKGTIFHDEVTIYIDMDKLEEE